MARDLAATDNAAKLDAALQRLRLDLALLPADMGGLDRVQAAWRALHTALEASSAVLPAAADHNLASTWEAVKRLAAWTPATAGADPPRLVLVLASCCRYNAAALPSQRLQTFGCSDVGNGGAKSDAIIKVGGLSLLRGF